MTKTELEQRFEKCWKEFCELYKKRGPRGADKAKIKKLTHNFKHSWARMHACMSSQALLLDNYEKLALPSLKSL